MRAELPEIFAQSWERLPPDCLAATQAETLLPVEFPQFLSDLLDSGQLPGYLPDLARLELARFQLRNLNSPAQPPPGNCLVNPTLTLLEVDWRPLLALAAGKSVKPEPMSERLLLWRHPHSGKALESVASPADLLALKVVAEGLDAGTVAEANDQPVGVIDGAIEQAVAKGLLLAPASALVRELPGSQAEGKPAMASQQTEVFTLQWHITHRCDLHCRHCYDRSKKEDVSLARGMEILDQMRDFCRQRHVAGQVSFSGGNPFLHPDFPALYRAACDRNLKPAILGNPVGPEQLDEILAIRRPAFFQVSLEGLQEHNDAIRGRGNFAAVLAYLDLLREKNIYSMVMLTLTRANLDQVLPLAELLRERVDLFTYNRLAMVGEGASLASPGPEEYRTFCHDYLEARKGNPIMALKDSLLNIELDRQGRPMFSGCTGFGCGAAFNFVSLLPDGQVHACRKFPSPIGDLNLQSLEQAYTSNAAEAYRRGCRGCDSCRLRANCGGCLAVAYGFGLDPLQERDPACFYFGN